MNGRLERGQQGCGVGALAFCGRAAFLLSLGDDVQLKQPHYYFAFKRLKNFATVDFQSDKFKVFVKVLPESLELELGFTRDVSDIGHWGTGNLEITIGTVEQLERRNRFFSGAMR